MNKKGISPLIATVLLIGFSVALAAVVMTWGLDFVRSSTEDVGTNTEQALKCATQLDYEISAPDCNSIVVQNNGVIEIVEITFRVFKGGNVDPTTDLGVPSLGVKTYPLDVSGASKVEAIATIRADNGQTIVCKDVVEEYATPGC